MNIINEINPTIIHVSLTVLKYFAYIVGTGTALNLLGMGKVFDKLLNKFAHVFGYIIGYILKFIFNIIT